MNNMQRDRIKHAANTEAVRRALIAYFMGRGFTESFDRSVNPVAIQDLPLSVVGLETKIEIAPHAVDIDPRTSRAVLGWNLFALGNQRMFLGETHHDNLLDLANQIKSNSIQPGAVRMTRLCTTPKRIIAFLERTLGSHDQGYVDLTPRVGLGAGAPKSMKPVNLFGGQNSQWLTRAGYGT